MNKGKFHYAYLIVASCIVIMCLPCALALSCAGIFFTPVSTFFGVPRASFTLYFSILNISMMISLPIAGNHLSRMDARKVLSGGTILTGAGLIGMSFGNSMPWFYVMGAIMGFGIAPLIYLSVPTLINNWCVKRVGFFVGLCMAFTGIGGVIFNPIGTAIIQGGPEGWRTAYLAFGIITLVGTLPFTLFVVRTKPEDKGLLPFGAEEAQVEETNDEAAQEGVPASVAMKTPAFIAIVIFCGIITLNQTIYQFLASYATSFEATLPQIAAASGVVASAAMAGQAIGKVVLGIVNDRSVKLGIVFGIACGVVGVLLMWFIPNPLPLLLAGAFLFGVVYAMTTVQTPLLVRSVFGSADYTNIYARVSMVGSLMSAVAAVFWSFVIDSPGGFPLMFILGLVCMAICFVTSFFALGQKDKIRA
ncbi:MAG: MFS transporter [Atopobiaceae bacterium]|nr:MFS transporter [Atopobiaceae bacterium]